VKCWWKLSIPAFRQYPTAWDNIRLVIRLWNDCETILVMMAECNIASTTTILRNITCCTSVNVFDNWVRLDAWNRQPGGMSTETGKFRQTSSSKLQQSIQQTLAHPRQCPYFVSFKGWKHSQTAYLPTKTLSLDGRAALYKLAEVIWSHRQMP
jgi:hypothetical protein